ncbi:MAG: ATP-binding protein [Bacteroidaceae bacterium]|nr:ATP-binding protein [Bacteroidaceae bacterium]
MKEEFEKREFVFGVAVEDYNFTDREQETRLLRMNFESGVNTILVSPRRWGKTSLVKKVARMIDTERVMVVYLDMFPCKTEYDFYNTLSAALLTQTASRKELWMENAREFVARLVPKISISPEPNSGISLSLGISPATHSPEEILNLPEQIARQKGKRIIVCIDEFQQIGEFADSITVQKRLRSVWQHQHLTNYCLFGSKKHLMTNLFGLRSKPFYQFGQMMYLSKIPISAWIGYIQSHFAWKGCHISDEIITELCTLVEQQSSYVQQLAGIVLSMLSEGQTTTSDHLKAAFSFLLDACTPLFKQQISTLTGYQLNCLRAIIAGHHSDLGERSVRDGFDLGSASNIPRLKNALLERDLIELDGREVTISDPVFARWLRECVIS